MMHISVDIDGAADASPPIDNLGNLKHLNQCFERIGTVLLAPHLKVMN